MRGHQGLLNRDGRYFARIVVPASPPQLRQIIGKTELRTPLGPDRRLAIQRLPAALAILQHQIAQAQRQIGMQPRQYELSPADAATLIYEQELRVRDHNRLTLGHDATAEINRTAGARLANIFRMIAAGTIPTEKAEALLGDRADKLAQHLPNKSRADLLRLAAEIQIEAIAEDRARDEGTLDRQTHHALLQPQEPHVPVKLSDLADAYLAELQTAGGGKAMAAKTKLAVESLRKHLGHNDASRITKANLIEWRDKLLRQFSPSTVKSGYVAPIAATLKRAHEQDQLPANAAATVKVRLAKKSNGREQGFTTAEATVILQACHAETNPLRRFLPFLAAFSGARIGELGQLRKEDFRLEGDTYVMRITPLAGTVKNRQYRDVPLHAQVAEIGFLDFLAAAPAGPLFHKADAEDAVAAAKTAVESNLSRWLRDSGMVPEGVAPHHGWRHRMKTQAGELGLDMRVIDAIQGHAARTAGENYGDVTIAARKRVIDALPRYEINS